MYHFVTIFGVNFGNDTMLLGARHQHAGRLLSHLIEVEFGELVGKKPVEELSE